MGTAFIDADERITPELEREFARPFAHRLDGFFISMQVLVSGWWINHCGYFPSWNLRLFRHRSADMNKLKSATIFFLETTKSRARIAERPRRISPTPMEHHAFPDIATFIEKHDRIIPRGKRPLGENCIPGMKNHCDPRLLEQDWNVNAGWKKLRCALRSAQLRFFTITSGSKDSRDGYRGWVLLSSASRV